MLMNMVSVTHRSLKVTDMVLFTISMVEFVKVTDQGKNPRSVESRTMSGTGVTEMMMGDGTSGKP